jgi:hypothetical protein
MQTLRVPAGNQSKHTRNNQGSPPSTRKLPTITLGISTRASAIEGGAGENLKAGQIEVK